MKKGAFFQYVINEFDEAKSFYNYHTKKKLL